MPIDAIVSQGPVTFEIAIEHACTRVPVFGPSESVERVRQALPGQNYESATHIVVCEEGRFLGILPIEDLLAAPADVVVGEVMDRDAPVVAPGVDQEIAARRAARRGEAALAVVDEAGRFHGLIRPHRLLAVLLSEHEEDLSRLSGILKTTSAARGVSEEPVGRRFRHRLPWLLLGLVGALLAADIVCWFESSLHDRLVLAFFIPGVVYLADAVGTQTETIVVRGLSVGVRLRRMLVRELLTGLMIGLTLAAVPFPVVLLRWGEWDVAAGVCLSLLAACSTATIVAIALPWLFDLVGLDPAFGSGPLATVIQDLLSILIYFAIAVAIVR